MATEYITIEQLAAERGVDRRTIMAQVRRGVLPPLPGDQSGVKDNSKGWPRPYWDEYLRLKARAAIEETSAA